MSNAGHAGPNRARKLGFRTHQTRLNKKWPPSDRNRAARIEAEQRRKEKKK